MKEPMLWFALIGGLLFTVDHFRAPDTIVVDDSVRSRIATMWETQMGKQPSDEELKSLTHDWVRQQVFYREALRLGLDRDDIIIQRRLVQKLGFLAQEVEEEPATSQEILDFYQTNSSDYSLAARYSLSLIYFTNEDRYASLVADLENGGNWEELGERSALPNSLIQKNSQEVISTFGTEFAEQLHHLKVGQWIGPVSSSFGLYIVRLDEQLPEQTKPFEHVQRQVLSDLHYHRREVSLENYYRDLLDQYEVDYQ